MSEPLIIRQATGSDLEKIIAMDPTAKIRASRITFLKKAVERNECYAAMIDCELAGFIVLEYTFFGHALISLLIVAQHYRRIGLGTALIRHAEKLCQTPKLFTSTNESNDAMRRLLPSLGYLPSGKVDNIDDGDPELIFYKRLF